MPHAEPGQILLELAQRQPEIEQRAEEHVAGDAGEDVEVQRARRPGGRARRPLRAG